MQVLQVMIYCVSFNYQYIDLAMPKSGAHRLYFVTNENIPTSMKGEFRTTL